MVLRLDYFDPVIVVLEQIIAPKLSFFQSWRPFFQSWRTFRLSELSIQYLKRKKRKNV